MARAVVRNRPPMCGAHRLDIKYSKVRKLERCVRHPRCTGPDGIVSLPFDQMLEDLPPGPPAAKGHQLTRSSPRRRANSRTISLA